MREKTLFPTWCRQLLEDTHGLDYVLVLHEPMVMMLLQKMGGWFEKTRRVLGDSVPHNDGWTHLQFHVLP